MELKFGLFYLPSYYPRLKREPQFYQEMIEQVEFADRNGFDSAWFVEHHFLRHGGILPSNFVFLAALAMRTERIRLGTGAVVMPFNDPVRVAEQAAMIDCLSNGRFELGVGRGFQKLEFDAFDVRMDDARGRLEEGIEIVKECWTKDAVEFHGRFRDFGPVNIYPKPVQTPHPRIWVAAFLSRESFDYTAESGYNLLFVAYHMEPQVARERLQWYWEAIDRAGRRREDHEALVCYHTYVCEPGEDLEALKRVAAGPIREYFEVAAEGFIPPDSDSYAVYKSIRQQFQERANFDVVYPHRVLMGTPEQVVERIREVADMGANHICLIPTFGTLPHEKSMASLERFAKYVMPHFKNQAGGAGSEAGAVR